MGSDLRMDCAYIDRQHNQAICCWEAPDRESVSQLFERAHVEPESIREVVQYQA